MDASKHGEDSQLIERIAKGDELAFSIIYRRYLPLVVRWCLRQTGDRELAADLSAEVFAAALTMSHRYRPGKGSVPAWLIGIAHNKLRESRRRGRVESSARARLGVQALPLTDDDIDRVEELASRDEEILDLLAELSDEQREAVFSRIVKERSYTEVAGELGCSEAVARQRVSRGLRALRAGMEER